MKKIKFLSQYSDALLVGLLCILVPAMFSLGFYYGTNHVDKETVEVRFQNNGACTDKWMDATVIDEDLMKHWLRKSSRSARKMTDHEFATYPYACYFPTQSLMSIASKTKCTEGKYKGKTFQEIFDKDVSYCVLMLELFAESKSAIRGTKTGGIGHLCRYLSTLKQGDKCGVYACRCHECRN
jgi:hypothetical protein